MRRAITLCLISALAAVDQLIKYAVCVFLKDSGNSPSIRGFVSLHYTENTGAAFSILGSRTALLTVLTAVMLTLCVAALMSGKIKSRLLSVSLTLICAGGLGNFIDRAARGYVVDYIELLFMRFAIFNFADCLVTVGAFMMIFYIVADTASDIKDKRGRSGDEKEDLKT